MNKLKISNLLRFRSFFKSFVITAFVVFVVVMAFIFNIKTEQSFDSESSLQEPYRVVVVVGKPKNQIRKQIAIEKTTEIIIRDGKNISPTTAKKYAKWIYAAGEKHKVNPVLILSVMSVESNFNAKAQSPTGPIGLLQVAYTHHKEKTTRAGLYDPKNNIDVGAQILAEYKGSSDVRTLTRYYGGGSGVSSSYARKVLSYKNKYEREILSAFYTKST